MTVAGTEEAAQAGQAQASPTVRAVEWAAVPRVNLLPPEILEGRRFRRVQLLLGLVVLLTLAGAGAATVHASSGVSDAQTERDAAQLRVTALQTRQAQYAEVPRVTAQLDALTAARAAAMAADITWYRYLSELRAALPAGVATDVLTVSVTGAAAAGSTQPLAAAGIGTLSLDGSAGSYDAVSAWLDALDKLTGIDSTALTSASESRDSTGTTVNFAVTAVVTDAALSRAFAEEGNG